MFEYSVLFISACMAVVMNLLSCSIISKEIGVVEVGNFECITSSLHVSPALSVSSDTNWETRTQKGHRLAVLERIAIDLCLYLEDLGD